MLSPGVKENLHAFPAPPPAPPDDLLYREPLPEPPREQPTPDPPVDGVPEPPPEPPQGPFNDTELQDARDHRTLHCRSIAEIRTRPVGWLWPRWLPHGFAWLEGDPGVNKSMLAILLSALSTTGRAFPGDTQGRSPMNVLYLTSGEDPDEVIRERFLRAKGDPQRMFLLDVRRIMTDPKVPKQAQGLPVLPDDAALIMDTARGLKVSLIILDVAYSFVSTKHDISSDHSLRAALEPFARTVADAGMTALGLRHLTKARQQAQHAGIGAVAGTAVARAVLVLNKDPKSSSTRLLGCTKLSYGAPHEGSLAFEVEAEGPLGAAWLSYSGTSEISASRATRLARDERASESERVFAQLCTAFEGAFKGQERIPLRGPVKETNVDSLATKAGYVAAEDFNRSRLARRVKTTLHIEAKQIKEGKTPKWYWVRVVE